MSTEQIWEIISQSSEDTAHIASQIGSRLRGGEVIVLQSDLGGGKTTFTKGLVSGLGGTDTVRSPSFTVSNEYRTGRLNVYHFDFYRLAEPGIVQHELQEVVDDKEGVVVIEWDEIVRDSLPANRIVITFDVLSQDKRKLTITFTLDKTYIAGGHK